MLWQENNYTTKRNLSLEFTDYIQVKDAFRGKESLAAQTLVG